MSRRRSQGGSLFGELNGSRSGAPLVDSGNVNAKPPQALDDSHQSMIEHHLDMAQSLDK
jgi:hypothetical protein